MSKIKLNSHVLHPQIKAKHCNAESAKLTNHDTTPPSGGLMGAANPFYKGPKPESTPTPSKSSDTSSSGKSLIQSVTDYASSKLGK
jgi:hypothetical protein